jgi:hypothetical protein
MIWGMNAVPMTGPVGWMLLGAALMLVGARLRKRPSPTTTAAVLFVAVLAVPLTGGAAQILLPHLFVNGTVADANEVNANFALLETESNDQDDRISNLEGPDYVSGWTAISSGGTVTFNHDLGVIPTRVTLQVGASASPDVVYIGGDLWKNLDSEGGRGTLVTDVTAMDLVVRSGTSAFCGVFDTFAAAGPRRCLASGYVRALVWD